MIEKPQVSVIMPLYNKETFVAEAIESVLAQSFPNFELIIIDDKSDDNSLEVAKGYLKSGKIKLIENAHRKGPAAARNLGILSSSSETVTFLDADDVYHKDKLLLQKNLVGEGVVVSSDWFSIGGRQSHPERITKEENVLPFVLGTDMVVNSNTLMLKKSDAIKAGMFDESLSSSEDLDFAIRLARLFKFKLVEVSLYGYRIDVEQSITHAIAARERWKVKREIIERYLDLYNGELTKQEMDKVNNRIARGLIVSRDYQRAAQYVAKNPLFLRNLIYCFRHK